MRRHSRARRRHLEVTIIMAKRHLTSERSFSVMRRLKTWLRRTTGQTRLNHELLLVIHSAREVRIDDVIHDFVSLNEQRQDDLGL